MKKINYCPNCGYKFEPEEEVCIGDFAEKWDRDAIPTKLGFVVAPENYKEGDKEHFTWNEAMEIQETFEGMGWRLPTVAELVQLYGAYGIDEDGEDDSQALIEKFNIPLAGYYLGSSLYRLGHYAFWWSSSAQSTTAGYNLRLASEARGVNPQNYDNKFYGFSVRLVKDDDDE